MRAIVPAMLLALALTGCSGHSSQPQASAPRVVHSPTPTVSAPPRPAPKPTPPPAANACYRLSFDQALAPTTSAPTVSCSRLHTAATFFVGAYPQKLPVDGKQVHQLEAKVCPRRFARYVGGSVDARRLSMLRAVWFTPTVRQASHGAHWFQCAAIALRGDQTLAFLRGPLHGAILRPAVRAQYSLCGTAEPGTTAFQQRICAAPHSWRALSIVDFNPGPYPGVAQARSAGQQTCQDAGRAAASNPLSYQWSYQWPTRAQWRAGQTYGVCWAPS